MFSNLIGLIRRVGLHDAGVEVAGRVLHALSFGKCSLARYYLFSQPLKSLPEIRQRKGSFCVRPVFEGDPVVSQFPRPAGEIAERFAAGSECLVAQHEGELAGFIWLHQGVFAERPAGLRFRPVPAEETVWDFDVYIAPQFRAGMAFYRLWSGTVAHLRRREVRFSVSFVLAHNENSIRSHLRLGAFPIASGHQLRIGNVILTLADRSPRLTLVTAKSPTPLFELDARPSAFRSIRRFRSQRPPMQDASAETICKPLQKSDRVTEA